MKNEKEELKIADKLVIDYYHHNIKTLDELHDKLRKLFNSNKEAVEWFADNDERLRKEARKMDKSEEKNDDITYTDYFNKITSIIAPKLPNMNIERTSLGATFKDGHRNRVVIETEYSHNKNVELNKEKEDYFKEIEQDIIPEYKKVFKDANIIEVKLVERDTGEENYKEYKVNENIENKVKEANKLAKEIVKVLSDDMGYWFDGIEDRANEEDKSTEEIVEEMIEETTNDLLNKKPEEEYETMKEMFADDDVLMKKIHNFLFNGKENLEDEQIAPDENPIINAESDDEEEF